MGQAMGQVMVDMTMKMFEELPRVVLDSLKGRLAELMPLDPLSTPPAK